MKRRVLHLQIAENTNVSHGCDLAASHFQWFIHFDGLGCATHLKYCVR